MNNMGEFNSSSDFPSEVSPAHNGLSVDVLIYSEKTGEHTVGWFSYKLMTWKFLCREPHQEFVWRYFNNEHDKPKINNMSQKEIKDSIIIQAKFIRETKDSYFLDCEGDPTWFPKSKINFNQEKEELELPKWLAKDKFPNEQF